MERCRLTRGRRGREPVRVQPVLKSLQKFAIKNSPGCLGFAPRSESFAIEPSVQVCSISSLSEFRFAQYVRKSAGLFTKVRVLTLKTFQINKRMGLTHPFIYEKTPQVGLEPTTYRLTAGCSAIELLRIIFQFIQLA